MGEPLLGTSSQDHYHQMVGKLQAYDIFVMLLLNLHTSTLMAITTWCHPLSGYMISSFWMQAHGKIPNPVKKHQTHISWVSSQSVIDNAHHTVRSHDPTRYIFYASCVDKLDTTLCTLSWSTLYLSNSLHEDDVLKVNMNVHTIVFFKTCLQYAQLSHDQSLDSSMNNTLVIT